MTGGSRGIGAAIARRLASDGAAVAVTYNASPEKANEVVREIGDVHRRYTRRVNFRAGWRGHLWQGRFSSFILDEAYLLTAARYAWHGIATSIKEEALAQKPRRASALTPA